MRRRVQQSVARHDSVLTAAPGPMVGDGFARGQVDELNTRATEHEILFSRLVSVASLVAHAGREERLVFRTGAFDLSGYGIAAFGCARITRPDDVSGPYKTIGDQDIDRGVVALARLTTPQPLTVLRRERNQLAHRCLATGSADDPFDLSLIVLIQRLVLGHGAVG